MPMLDFVAEGQTQVSMGKQYTDAQYSHVGLHLAFTYMSACDASRPSLKQLPDSWLQQHSQQDSNMDTTWHRKQRDL